MPNETKVTLDAAQQQKLAGFMQQSNDALKVAEAKIAQLEAREAAIAAKLPALLDKLARCQTPAVLRGAGASFIPDDECRKVAEAELSDPVQALDFIGKFAETYIAVCDDALTAKAASLAEGVMDKTANTSAVGAVDMSAEAEFYMNITGKMPGA